MPRRHVPRLLALVVALGLVAAWPAADADAQAQQKPARVGYPISGSLATVEGQ